MIDDICRDIPGFTSPEFLEELYRLAYRRVLAIEIGAFKGRSTAVLARAVTGVVYSIDIWDTRMYDPVMLESDGMHYDECLAYRVFLTNMRHFHVSDKVIPMIGNSHWLERYFKNKSISLVFVDGDHAENMVMKDIHLYLPKLEVGGVMCGDDYNMPSVKKPVDAMAFTHGFTVETFDDGKGWIYRK